MEQLNKKNILLAVALILFSNFAKAKSTDLGVCFLKTSPQTIQNKINEIALSGQENVKIQQQVRFFNDLTSSFVPIDTFNYKLFWVQKPNNDWLTQNCFKYGYITLLDYNRRAITRVYSSPSDVIEDDYKPRMPAAVPKADPPQNTAQNDVGPRFNPVTPAPQTPNITYNYYGGAPVAQNSQNDKKVEIVEKTTEKIIEKEEKKPEPVIVEKNICKNENKGDVYALPSYLSDSSYFFSFDPFMAYEDVAVVGSSVENKFNLFTYGADFKIGYRFGDGHFNVYAKTRYDIIDLRTVRAPVVANIDQNTDLSYGVGIEHVASRFLSLAIEYNMLHVQSFVQTAPLTTVDTNREDFQTVNLDFKLNFIARDDLKLGLAGNYGLSFVGTRDELIFDAKTKLFVMRTFEKGFFGLNLGYEHNKFNYITTPTDSVSRKRWVFGLNYGFDL